MAHGAAPPPNLTRVSRIPLPTVAAEDVITAVETYADRLHDLLRRRGLGVADAGAVVAQSAEDLVDIAAADPPLDPLGWWWARALSRGDRTRNSGGLRDRAADPVDAALSQLPDPLQLAVLLRDDYDLPLVSTATALGVGLSLTADRVLQGRLRLVAEHDSTDPVSLDPHTGREQLDSALLLGLADGTLTPADAARARRHLRSCPTCPDTVETAQRGRRLAAALPVDAMPDAARDELLERVRSRASDVLPALNDLLTERDELMAEQAAERLVPLPLVLVCLAGALVAGALTGAMTAPARGNSAAAGSPDGSDPSATPSVDATATATPTPTVTPTAIRSVRPTRTTTVSPSAKVTTAPPVVTGPASISANPESGPNGQLITVTGTGWVPGTSVTVDYLDSLGNPRSSDIASVQPDGTFTARVTATDTVGLPGQHTIRASDGSQTVTTTYTVR